MLRALHLTLPVGKTSPQQVSRVLGAGPEPHLGQGRARGQSSVGHKAIESCLDAEADMGAPCVQGEGNVFSHSHP